MGHELVQVLGEGVVVIAGCGLAGLTEPSAVVGDDPMARLQKDRKLLLPRSAAQGYPWIKTTGSPEP